MPALILNVILFSNFLFYLHILLLEVISYFVMIFVDILKIFDTEYNPSGDSNFLFPVGSDVLIYFFLMTFLYFSVYNVC